MSETCGIPDCPPITANTIRAAWVGWSSDDIRVIAMDLSDPANGLLALSWWRDSTYTMLFRLVQQQTGKGSTVLFFKSIFRGSNDKVVVTGKGTACDSAGSIEAEIQLLFKRNIFSKDVKLTFYKDSPGKSNALDLLKRIELEARKEIQKSK